MADISMLAWMTETPSSRALAHLWKIAPMELRKKAAELAHAEDEAKQVKEAARIEKEQDGAVRRRNGLYMGREPSLGPDDCYNPRGR